MRKQLKLDSLVADIRAAVAEARGTADRRRTVLGC